MFAALFCLEGRGQLRLRSNQRKGSKDILYEPNHCWCLLFNLVTGLKEQKACFVWYTISESLSDFLLKSQIPVEALWSLRSIHLRVIALHPSFVNSRMPQNALIVPLTSEPIRVNVFSFEIYKRGNSQYPEQRSQTSWCTLDFTGR